MNAAILSMTGLLAQAANQAGPQPGGDQTMLIWAIAAFGLAIILVVVEAFVPSGGILGALAGVCVIISIILFFWFDTFWGLVSMAITLLCLPFLIAGLIWIWPNTFIGQLLTLDESQTPLDNAESQAQEGAIHVGMQGQAITALRPVGACRLGGQRTDCIAGVGVIEPGTAVRVIYVEGTTIKVAAV